MNFDMETLIAIKSSFQANEFQWIKTSDPNKIGKVVTVRDVVPGRNGRFVAILSDGTQLDTDLVSSDLMMITDDQQPLSMAEIRSINYVPSLSEEQSISPDLPPEIAAMITQTPPERPAQREEAKPAKIEVDPSDLFGMFSLEDTDLNLSVKLKLPSKNLLKMMYTNAKNKDEFLTKLANYINNNVTVDSIKKTMKKSLGSTGKSKATGQDE